MGGLVDLTALVLDPGGWECSDKTVLSTQHLGFRGLSAFASLALISACGSDSGGGSVLTGNESGLTATTTTSGSAGTSESDDGTDDGPKLDANPGGTAETGGSGDPCMDAAEAKSNQGCLFWAVDLPNAWVGTPSPNNHQFAVVVANTVEGADATVRTFIGNETTPIDTDVVPSGALVVLPLPAMNIPERQNSYDGVAFRFESDVPVTAYQFNPLDNNTQVFSNDASLLFPEHALGTEYTAITGDGIQLAASALDTPDNSGAFVSIVATEDNTVVDVFPTVDVYPGATEDIVINRGQVATIVSNATIAGATGVAGQGNLSGTRVSADKPVAVFSGNVATLEPQPGACCADHLEHQMLPIAAWGTGYVTAPVPVPGNPGASNRSAYRITGAFDATNLVYNPSTPPGAPSSIGADQTVRFETDQPFSVATLDPDKPFALTQFLLSNQQFVTTPPYQNGDPAMIALPAAAQYQTRYVFSVPEGYASNYVSILRPSGAMVLLDGNDVSIANWTPAGAVDGKNYEFVRLELTQGAHTIESDEPVGIVSIGYDVDVSYGFPGGSGLEIISTPPPSPAD